MFRNVCCFALKGQANSAQGNALGTRERKGTATLKGLHKPRLNWFVLRNPFRVEILSPFKTQGVTLG
jgi:hypothetical protein